MFSTIIDTMILAGLIPGFAITQTASGRELTVAIGPCTALGSLAVIGIFRLWFRPSFDGMLKNKDFLKELLLLSPVLILHWVGSAVSRVQFGTSAVFLAFLRAFAPVFVAETAFRGLGVANYLRKDPAEKGIVKIFRLSSLV